MKRLHSTKRIRKPKPKSIELIEYENELKEFNDAYNDAKLKFKKSFITALKFARDKHRRMDELDLTEAQYKIHEIEYIRDVKFHQRLMDGIEEGFKDFIKDPLYKKVDAYNQYKYLDLN